MKLRERLASVPPWAAAGVTAVGMLALVGLTGGVPCIQTGLLYGVWLDRCPATQLRLVADVSVNDLRRGEWSTLNARTMAEWKVSATRESVESAAITPDYLVGLLNAEGVLVPGLELRWEGTELQVRLPMVPDGDYRLRVTIDAGFETLPVEIPVPLYANSLVHVLSDRPLYKAGQDILLRAAVLRRSDATPIAQRPGTWGITAPDGTEMLVEKSPTDAWGVSATTFPLASDAEEGTWLATYHTGNEAQTLSVEVRPFQLPRYLVEVKPSATWYGPFAPVLIEGNARYTTGAPVADAEVEVRVRQSEGRWPLPLSWEEPFKATTDAQGRFSVELGDVPGDLVDLARLTVNALVIDQAGERRSGNAGLVLSEDALAVDVVTEFGGGLVEAFNNRAYLRVTRPDGTPLPLTPIELHNPYDPAQPAMLATTDEEGVAAIQLDPGAPVTIITPPPPVRVRPFEQEPVSLASASLVLEDRSLSMPERRGLDALHPALMACGVYAVGAQNVNVGVQLGASGRVTAAQAGPGVLGQCVEQVMRGWAVPPRRATSTVDLTWTITDANLPSLRGERRSVIGDDQVGWEALQKGALLARSCFTRGVGNEVPVLQVHWTQERRRLATTIDLASGTGLSPETLRCVASKLVAAPLPDLDLPPAMGTAVFRLQVPQPPGQRRASAQSDTGFQLQVRANGEATDVRFPVGALPPLRIRATPTLAKAGDTISLEFLRGPGYSGELPEELPILGPTGEILKAKVDRKARTASFALPADAHGFVWTEWEGARAALFVTRSQPLTVSLSTDKTAYAPGETATLRVQTLAGADPVEASVTLAGVDAALAELMPLVRPDDWGNVTVRATGEDAFGRYGPRALELGQVRGENAARAAVLLVQSLPTDDARDNGVYASVSQRPPQEETLVAAFYRGVEALIPKVRAWEASAPADALMDPKRVSQLWSEVLRDAKEPLVDAYGRTLVLKMLPPDLLVQLDPRTVVSDSRRLPEDVEDWVGFVRGTP